MANDYIRLDVEEVKRQIDALLSAYPEMAEDEALLADMIEGSTAIDKVVSRALDHVSEAQMMVAAIKEHCSHQQDRAAKFERRAEAMRGMIRELMLHANIKSLPLPLATVSIQNGRQSVQITDEDSVPRQLGTTSWKPDKKAISEQIGAGVDVPGAAVVTGQPTLSIRVK